MVSISLGFGSLNLYLFSNVIGNNGNFNNTLKWQIHLINIEKDKKCYFKLK